MSKASHITHRIVPLERCFMRSHMDFQPDAVAQIKKAGFNGVFVNGGSGFGPDQWIRSILSSQGRFSRYERYG